MADKIKFGVGFDVDKTSLNSLKSSLEELTRLSIGDVMKINTSNLQDAKTQLNTIRATALQVQDAFEKAFNQKLNTVNIQTFNKELTKSGLTIQQVYDNFKLAGAQGASAFRSLANQVTSTNTQLKQTHTILDKIGETLGNTIKWNIASGAVNKLSGSIQEAYGYVKALDGSLNDIQIVTGKSAESMAIFAKQANDAAKSLGTTTTNYTKSALTFYQQGLSDQEVQARAELSNKVSNVTGLSGDQAAEYVTAVLNGYKVGSEEAEEAMDKLAAVAAATASDLAELSEGMSKVASAGHAMGVTEDQLAATLSTVISVTRQSASSIGTAFKTIYARISDIEAGTEEAEISLGDYSAKMAEMGFSVLDSSGHLRDLGTVMEEIGVSWKTLSREQQVSLAQTMAGTRQYNNLIALFDNWDEYMRSLNVSMEANGTLQEQQNTYMESTKAHLNQLSTSMEDVYDSLLDPNAINNIADVTATLANITADWIDSIRGGTGVLETLGSVAVMVFSRQIGSAINTTIENFLVAKNNAEQLKMAMDAVQQFKSIEGLDKASQQMLDMKDSMYQLAQVMSPESFDQIQESVSIFTTATNQVDMYEEELDTLNATIERLGYNSDDFVDNIDEINQTLVSNIKNFKKLQIQAQQVQENLIKIKLGSSNTLGEDVNVANKSIQNLIKSAEDMHANGEITEATWERMSNAIKQYNKVLEEATENGQDFSNNEDLINSADRVVAVIDGRLANSIKSTKELMNQLATEAGFDGDSIKLLLQTAQEEADKTGKDVQAVLQNAARQEIISNFTKMAGAISSVGFAIQNIQNIGNIWQDDDLSTGEKILQTATNLATTLPMLLSGYTSLKTGIQGITSAKKIYTAATTALATAETTETVVKKGATTAQLSFNAALLANPLTWAIVAVIGAAAAAYGIYSSSVKAAAEAEKERLAASVDNAVALGDEADAVNNLYIAYKNLYDTFSTTGEGEDNLRSSVLELADAFGIQVDTLDLLAGKYDKINKKIQEVRVNQAKTALEESRNGAASAEKQLGIEGSETNSYDTNRRDITFKTGFFYDKSDKATNEILNSHLDGLDSTGLTDASSFLDATVTIGGVASDSIIDAYQRIQDAYDEMTNTLSADTLDNSELYSAIRTWLDDNKEYYNKYTQLQQDTISRAQEFAEAQSALIAQDYDITEVDSYTNYTKYKEQYINQLRDALGGDENIVYDEDLFNSTDEYLEHLASEYLGTIDHLKEYAEDADIANAIKKAFLAGFEEPSAEDEQVINNYLQTLSDKDLKLIATIGIDEGATIDEIQKTLDLASTKVNNASSKITAADAINTIMASYSNDKSLTKSQQEDLANAQSMLDTYLATTEGIRGMTSAAKEWEIVSAQGTLAQIEYLQDLAALQNQYATNSEEDIRNELSLEQELLISKQNRLAEEASAMDILNQKVLAYEELKKNPDFNANSDEAKAIFESADAYETAKNKCSDYRIEIQDVANALDEVQEKLDGDLSLEVDMSNVEEILTVGDTILSEAEKIKSAAELIGEGFTVAAEDADKLAEVFPELLDNATVTADGIIQLDQETVNALLSGQADILNGDVQTAVAKIDNQIDVLQAKKEAAEAELELANAVARGEISIEEALAKTKADGNKQLADYLMQLGLDETEAQKAAAEAMAGNMDEYNRIAGEVADETANNLANAMAEAANKTQTNSSSMIESLNSILRAAHQTAAAIEAMGSGEQAGSESGEAEGGGASGTDFSSTVNKGGFKGAKPHKVSTSDIQLNDWQDQLLGDIAGYDAAIAQMTALKAKLLANQKNAQNALNGASSGAGGKPVKDKGGSGGGKDKEADYIEALEDELDVYHDIDIQIQEITDDLSKLQKEQDRLTGKDFIDNLNKQLDILQKQKKAYADKIELAKMEASAYKNVLGAYGATFDNVTGEITNYYDLLQAQLNKTNEAIAHYNSLSADAQTEEEKKKVENAKQSYNQLKQLIGSYEKIINNLIPDLEAEIEDALAQEIDIQLEKFDMSIQLRLDMSEAERDWNEFKRKVIDGIDDDLTGKATQSYKDFLSYYNTNGTGTGSIQAQTERVNSILNELQKIENGSHSSIYSAYDQSTGKWIDDKAKAVEDLKKSYSDLMKDLETLEDLENNVRDAFLESIDAVDEAFNRQKESYEFIGAQIEHDIKMIELLYGDKAYDKMEAYYDKQLDGTKAELAAQEQAVKYWKEKMEIERAAVAAGNGDKEALTKYEANWKESVSNVNQLLENWATQVTTKYENTVDKMIQILNDKMSNGLGLEYLDEELSLLNDNAENYLDNINSAYAVQKLSNKWQDAINNTDSVSAQKQLNALMQEQMAMLEKKGKLTQYDIDRAEKEYEIALKQIALQEAQQNKSKMRLKRDANGNYSYQFVSDEDSIRDAEQELAAAKNELYNFDKSAYQNNLNEMYSTWNEFQQKIADAYKTYAGDQDALNEHIALLQEQYGEKINYLTEQNLNIRGNLTNSAFEELANMYGTDISNFQNMTEEEKNLILNDLVPQWNSGVQQMIDKFSGEGGFEAACQETFDKLSKAANKYKEEMDSIGGKNQEISNEVLEQGNQLLEQSNQLIESTKEEYNRIGEVINQVNKLRDAYEAAKKAAIAATEAAYGYTQSTSDKNSFYTEGNTTDSSNGSNSGSSSSGSSETGSSSEAGSSFANQNGQIDIGDIVTYTGKYYYDSYGHAAVGNYYSGVSNGVVVDATSDNPYGIHIHSADGQYPDLGWVKKDQLIGYDTGGYTGTWDNNGRLALLHQKELVLNTQDTANVLSAVNILRGIVNSIGENTLNKVSSLLSNLGTTVSNNSNAEAFEQTVYITAKFEGQTEADQIETALSNLVNVAAQRANRTKK